MPSEETTCQLEDLPLDSSLLYVYELRNYLIRSYPFKLARKIFLSVSKYLRSRALCCRQKTERGGKNHAPLTVTLKLRPGELVEVRSKEEILATLDKRGKFQGLTFLPEMFQFCGKKFRVFKRLERMFVEGKGMRRIKNTVLLNGVICKVKRTGGVIGRVFACGGKPGSKGQNSISSVPAG